MKNNAFVLAWLLWVLPLGACGTDTSRITPATTTFATATGQATDAERTVMAAVGDTALLAAESAERSNLQCGTRWVLAVEKEVVPTMSPAQYQVRLDVLDSLKLYADKMAALSGTSANQDFDTQTKALATSLSTLTSDAQLALSFPKVPSNVTVGLAAAVSFIGNLVLDKIKVQAVTDAAAKMQEPLERIVAVIEADNKVYQSDISSNSRAIFDQIARGIDCGSADPKLIKDPDRRLQYTLSLGQQFDNGRLKLQANKAVTADAANRAFDSMVKMNKALSQPASETLFEAAAEYGRRAQDAYNKATAK